MITYYEIIPSRRDYKGERFFKYDNEAEKVVQVTLNQGEPKMGRANCFGIGLISRIGFLTNYLSMGYVVKITKTQYEKRFNQVLEMLR